MRLFVCFVYLIGQGECYVHYFLHSRTFQFRNTTVIHRRYISCFISLSLLPRLSGVTVPLFYKFVTYMTIINTNFFSFLINTHKLHIWCSIWDGELSSVVIGHVQSPYFCCVPCTLIHTQSAILSFYSQALVWDWSRVRGCYKKLYCLRSSFL